MTDNTRCERAARVRAKKLAAGMASRTIYLPAGTLEELRQAFPGPLGGIAWETVAAAALERRNRLATNAQAARLRRERKRQGAGAV